MIKSTERHARIQRVIIIEGAANLFVLTAKTIVGFSTGSLAVLGDAIHSLTDLANNVVAWIVIRLSNMPADREHPYGHRKFETLAVFFLASLLVVLAFELGLNAIRKENVEIASGRLELGIMVGVLIINIIVAWWQRIWAQRLKSDILLADASHTFSDVLITLAVITGWQLSAHGYPWLDRICALGVSSLILYLAYSLFKRAIPTLVDQYAIDPEVLISAVQEVKGVRGVLRVRSRWIGSSPAVDLVITVDPELSTTNAHGISDQVESLIETRFHITDVSIHVEPYSH
ncbi:MAG: cation diffusion facilitator family transporter [Gammaproteobacteria bacterium]|nr:cation diffusion facilitator family transporter [Gammaproteobacteria bacterium]